MLCLQQTTKLICRQKVHSEQKKKVNMVFDKVGKCWQRGCKHD